MSKNQQAPRRRIESYPFWALLNNGEFVNANKRLVGETEDQGLKGFLKGAVRSLKQAKTFGYSVVPAHVIIGPLPEPAGPNWNPSTQPPDGELGSLTRNVVVVTNFGQATTLSYQHGKDGAGEWQVSNLFRAGEHVVLWCDMPSRDEITDADVQRKLAAGTSNG